MRILQTISRPRTVWALAALVPLLTIAVLALEYGLQGTVLSVSHSEISADIPEFVFDGHGGIEYAVGMTIVAAIGAAIATRFRNAVGALLCLAVLTDALGAVMAAYGYRSIIVGELPGGVVAGLIGSVFPVLLLMLIIPGLILVFPTGRVRSPRWRLVLRLAAIAATYLIVGQILYPLVLGLVPNPIRAGWSLENADSFLGIGWTAWMGVVVLAATSLIWRLVDGGRWLTNRGRDRSSRPTTTPSAP